MLEMLHVLDFFTTQYSYTPSTLGNQLDGLRLESERMPQLEGDGLAKIEEALSQAEVFRCVEALRVDGPPVDGKWGRVYPALSKARDASRGSGKHLKMGELICALLHDYQEFGTRDPSRGLGMVYRRLSSLNSKSYPSFDSPVEPLKIAGEAYADALLALDAHVRSFNARSKKRNATTMAGPLS